MYEVLCNKCVFFIMAYDPHMDILKAARIQ